jgi:DnaJ-class molecular chaperone
VLDDRDDSMTAEGITCPICIGVGNLGEKVRCLNCSGKGITDADSLYTAPLSGKVYAKYERGSVS